MRFFTSICMVFLLLTPFKGNCQNNEDADFIYLEKLSGIQPHLQKKWQYSNWKYPVHAAGTIGGTFHYYMNYLFPDSNVVWVVEGVNGDSIVHHKVHSVGASFDPRDVNFEVYDDGVRLRGRYCEYYIDSLYFPYEYIRNVDSIEVDGVMKEVVDTLVIQIIDKSSLALGILPAYQEVYAKPDTFNTTTLKHSRSKAELIVPLTAKDTAYSQIFAFNHVEINGLDPINGVSITFKTMLPYKYGDTIESISSNIKSQGLNYLGHSMLINSGQSVHQYDYYNNSFWVTSKLRYGTEDEGWFNSKPGNAYEQDRYFDYAIFITSCTIGISDLHSERFNISPNPTSGKVEINLQAPIETIKVLNYQGQLIESIEVEGLSSYNLNLIGSKGLYYIEINSKDGSVHRTKVMKY